MSQKKKKEREQEKRRFLLNGQTSNAPIKMSKMVQKTQTSRSK